MKYNLGMFIPLTQIQYLVQALIFKKKKKEKRIVKCFVGTTINDLRGGGESRKKIGGASPGKYKFQMASLAKKNPKRE